MNRDRYRLVYSRRLGFRVPAAEHAKSAGSSARRRRAGTLLAAVVLLSALPAWARNLPIAAATFIRPGHANNVLAPVMENARTMVVTQLDGRPAVMQWQNFDIGSGYTVRFDQPTSQSRAINIVLPGGPRSEIYGNLKANGQVFLFNQAGILFGPGAVVDVAGLVASSLKLNDKLIEQSLSALSAYNSADKAYVFGEAALAKDGSTGDVEVAAGARIVAAENGRVLIAAPNVVNAGEISTPGGQTILAAGEKLYLADSIDSRLRGVLVEVSGGGTVTNAATGSLLSERGNITLAGLNVNQLGSARTTTTVTLNGSIYLQARDAQVAPVGTNLTGAFQGGALAFGEGSQTTVDPETARTETLRDDASFNRSEIAGFGKTVTVGGNARVVARGGEITLTAHAAGMHAGDFTADADAAIDIAAGAVLDASGLRDVEVASDRNYVQVELRGDELKDSPLQRDPAYGRPLYGKKIWLDVVKGFTSDDAPLADISGYRAGIERGVAELASIGGDINLQSAGRVNLAAGATLDISGGSVLYKGGSVPESYLQTAGGGWVKAADATAGMRFSGVVATRQRTLPSRLAGHDAGRIAVTAGRASLDGNLQATTVAGMTQRKASLDRVRWFDWSGTGAAADLAQILGKQLLERERDRVMLEQYVGNPLKKPFLTQTGRIAWDESTRPLGGQLEFRADLDDPAVPTVGDIALVAALPAGAARVADTTYLQSSLLGSAGFDRLLLQGDGTFSIDQAVNVTGLPGARLEVQAQGFDVAGRVYLPGGQISLEAREVNGTIGTANVADGAILSTAGTWTNDIAEPALANDPRPVASAGGSIDLKAAGDMTVAGALDVSAGAWRDAKGKLHFGDGGGIALETGNFGDGDTVSRRLDIAGATFSGYATGSESLFSAGRGGSFSLATSAIEIGSGTPFTSASGLLHLDDGFLRIGGFSDFVLHGFGGLKVDENATLAPRPLVRAISNRSFSQRYGADLSAFSSLRDVDASVRGAATLTLDATRLGNSAFGTLEIGSNSAVRVDAGGSITLKGQQQLLVDGTLAAAGGNISLSTSGESEGGINDALVTDGRIHLGEHAVVDVSGTVARDPAGLLNTGQVLDGGTIDIAANYGYLVAHPSASLRADGAAAVLDLVPARGAVRQDQAVASAGGSIHLMAREGLLVDADLSARAGGPGAAGGSLDVRLSSKVNAVTWDRSDDASAVADLNPVRRLELGHGGSSGAAAFADDEKIPSSDYLGKARFDIDKLGKGGFQNASFASSDYLVFASNLNFVVPGHLTLEAPNLLGNNAAEVTLSAGNLLLMQSAQPSQRSVPFAPKAGAGGGSLTLAADDLEVRGQVALSGFAANVLESTGDLRLSGLVEGETLRGQLATDGNLTLRAEVVYPTTGSKFDVSIRNNPLGVLRIEAVGSDHPVLSALGELNLVAPQVKQYGRIRAPFGKIGLVSGLLADAGERLSDQAPQAVDLGDGITEVELGAGSLTSLSAEGLTLLYGETKVAGRDWVFDNGSGQTPLLAAPEKRLILDGNKVSVTDGATIDLSGGGDLKAWEFVRGRGGSSDVLAQGDGTIYAIVPTLGGTVPYAADTWAGSDLQAGRVIRLLEPVGGLAAGTYTLLPARYALMDGAYAIRLRSDVNDLAAGAGLTQQDGTQVMGAYLGDALRGGAYTYDSRSVGVEVWNGSQVRLRSEYLETQASKYFKGGALPADAGHLTVAAGKSFDLEGIVRANAAAGGRGALVDLTAQQMALVNDAARARPGEVVVSPELLARLNAESVLLGATRERVTDAGDADGAEVWLVKTDAAARGAASVRVDTAGGPDLVAPELILAARDSLTLEAGSAVVASGTAREAEQVYRIDGTGSTADGAFLRVSAGGGAIVERNAPARGAGKGNLFFSRNAQAAGRSLNLDATGTVTLQGADAGRTQFALTAPGGVVELAADGVAVGEVPMDTPGLVLAADELSAMNAAARLTLRSYGTVDLYGSAALGSEDLKDLVIDAAGMVSHNNGGLTQTVDAKRVTFRNTGGASSGGLPGDATDSVLKVTADEIVLGPSAADSNFAFAGSARVELDGGAQIVGVGQGHTVVSGDLDLVAGRLTVATAAEQAIAAGGNLQVLNGDEAAPSSPAGIGGSLTLTGKGVAIAGEVEAVAGDVTVEATEGNVMVDGIAGKPARIAATGTTLTFGTETYAISAGSVRLVAASGDVRVGGNGVVDVSAGGGADAGTLSISAAQGIARLDGQLKGSAAGVDGTAPAQGRFVLDVESIAEENGALSNIAARTAEFREERSIRVRKGDLLLDEQDSIVARSITLAADDGSIALKGELDASGDKGGEIRVFANAGERVGSGRLTVDGARLLARGTGVGGDGQGTAGEGGTIILGVSANAGSTQAPRLGILSGSFDAGSAHARKGQVIFSAPQGADGVSVAIDSVDTTRVSFDAREVAVEGYVRESASQLVSGSTNNSATILNLGGVYDLANAAVVAAGANVSTANRPVAHEAVAMFGRDLLGAASGDDYGRLARADAGSYLGMQVGDLVRDASGNNDLYAAASAAIEAAFRGVTVANTVDNQRQSVAAVISAGLLALGTPQEVADQVSASVVSTLQTGGTSSAVLSAASTVLSTHGFGTGSAAQTFVASGNAAKLVDVPLFAAKAVQAAAAATSPDAALKAAVASYADDRSSMTTAQANVLATQVATLGNIGTGRYRAFAAARRFIGHGEGILANLGLSGLANATVNHDLRIVSSQDIAVAADVDLGDVAITTASDTFANTARLDTGALAVWHSGGNAGRLTLEAEGDVKLDNNLFAGMTRAFRSTTNASTQVYLPVMSEPAATGTPSWAIRIVAGADPAAADPLAVKVADPGQKGSVELANGKTLRGGEAGIEIAARNNVVLKGSGSSIQTVGVADAGSMAFINSTVTTTSRDLFARDGGDITILAGGSLLSTSTSAVPLVTSWLQRIGSLDAEYRITGTSPNQTNPAWYVKLASFKQGVGTLGGGDLRVAVGDDVSNLALVTATNGRVEGAAGETAAEENLKLRGGGDLFVTTGGDVENVTLYAALNDATVRAGGKLNASLALGDASASLVAKQSVSVGRIFNPTLDGTGTGIYFSTYGDHSAARLFSRAGDVSVGDFTSGPAVLSAVAAVGGATLTQGTLLPNPVNDLTVLAAGDVVFGGTVTVTNADPEAIPSPWAIGVTSNEVDFSGGGISPNLLAARAGATLTIASGGGDVIGPDHARGGSTPALRSAVPVRVSAAGDVVDFGLEVTHTDDNDVSAVVAGGDVKFNTRVAPGTGEPENISTVGFLIDGPGQFRVSAGRNVDLANSYGIVSRGNARNAYLPERAASIEVLAGVAGTDPVALLATARPGSVTGSDIFDRIMVRELSAVAGREVNLSAILADEANVTLTERRTNSRAELQLWFDRYDAALLAAMRDRNAGQTLDMAGAQAIFAALPVTEQQVFYETQRLVLNEILFAAVRYAGRIGDALGAGKAGYDAGFEILAKAFPAGGTGNIEGFLSQIKTEQDVENTYSLASAGLPASQQEHASAIALMAPFGATNIGIPGGEAGDPTRTGVVAIGKGNVDLIVLDSIEVGPSRIFTLGGGSIQGWSSTGDIDGGNSPKTAAATPPPTLRPVGDSFVLDVSGSVAGGGIATLKKDPSVRAAPVRLYAPQGAVDAGDAGIRVSGDLEIGAQQIIGADNISVGGSLSSSAASPASVPASGLSGSTTTVATPQEAMGAVATDGGRRREASSFLSVEILALGDTETSQDEDCSALDEECRRRKSVYK